MKRFYYYALFAIGILGWWECLAAYAQEAPASQATFHDPLVDAADQGNLLVIQNLLRQGADVNARGWLDVTPLMRAAYRGNGAMTEYLIQAGADINRKDIGGATALHLASREGHANIVQLLLAHGAERDAKDDEGWTPLMRASLAGHEDAAKALLKYGANVHNANARGETALMHAVQNRSEPIAALLLAEGANPEQANAFGVSAEQMAQEKNLPQIGRFLSASSAPGPAQTSQQTAMKPQAESLNELEPAGMPMPEAPSESSRARAADKDGASSQFNKRRMPEDNKIILNQQATTDRLPTPLIQAPVAPEESLANRPDLAPFLDERGEVDFSKVRSYGATVLVQIEQQEAAHVQQALDSVRAQLAREAAERIEKTRIQAEAEAAARIEDAKIKMAQFESGMRRYAGQTQAAIDSRAVASGVMDVSFSTLGYEDAYAPAAGGNYGPVATPMRKDAGQAPDQDIRYVYDPSGAKWLRAQGDQRTGKTANGAAASPTQPGRSQVTSSPGAYYDALAPSGYPPTSSQAAARRTQADKAEASVTFSEKEVKALVDAAVKQALENRAADIIREAEEKAASLEAKAERKMSAAMTAALQTETRKQDLPALETEKEGRVEVARAVIEPAPAHSPNAEVDYEIAATPNVDENAGIWLEIGDFSTGRDAISHFASISRQNALRGLKPRILYPEEDRTHVAIQIGPLNSYDAARQLCTYFRTDAVDCILLNN